MHKNSFFFFAMQDSDYSLNIFSLKYKNKIWKNQNFINFIFILYLSFSILRVLSCLFLPSAPVNLILGFFSPFVPEYAS